MLELVRLLVHKFIIPSNIVVAEDHLSEIVDKVLQLMLCILNGLHTSNDLSTISSLSSLWAPVFELRNPRYHHFCNCFGFILLTVTVQFPILTYSVLDVSLLKFIKSLLSKDPYIVYAFRINILR